MSKTISVEIGGEASGFNRVIAQVADSNVANAGRFSSAVDKAAGKADGAEGLFMGTADLFDGIGGTFGINTSGATDMMRSMGDLAGGFAIVAPIVMSLSSVWTAIGAVMAANPVGLAIVGVALVAAGLYTLYKKSEMFRDIVDGTWRTIAGVFSGVLGGLRDQLNGLGAAVSALGDLAVQAFTAPGRILLGLGKSLWNTFASWWNENLAGRTYGQKYTGLAEWGVNAVGGAGTVDRFRRNLGGSTAGAAAIGALDAAQGSYTFPSIPMLAKGGVVSGGNIYPLPDGTAREVNMKWPPIVTLPIVEKIMRHALDEMDKHPHTAVLNLDYSRAYN